jgi:hypothetical protein
MAVFHQAGGGFFHGFPVHANVWWKVSESNSIVWIKGLATSTGL